VTLLFLRVGFPGSEAERVDALWGAVQRTAREQGLAEAGLTIRGGGDLLDVRAEHGALLRAAVAASAVTISLVLLALFAYFRRFRALPLLGLAMAPPLLATFAFAAGTVGALNASSAFLNSIVIGNGINPNIIWLARFFEGRRRGVERVRPCASRGRTATRRRPRAPARRVPRLELPRRAAGLAILRPRTVLATSAVLSLGSAALVAWAVARDPMEYDFRNLQARRDPGSEVDAVNALVGEVVDETMSGSALAVLLPKPGDARQVQDDLEAARAEAEAAAAEAGDTERPATAYGAVRTVFDLLPEDQNAKVPLLGDIRTLLLDARRFADPETQARIDDELPPDDAAHGPRGPAGGGHPPLHRAGRHPFEPGSGAEQLRGRHGDQRGDLPRCGDPDPARGPPAAGPAPAPAPAGGPAPFAPRLRPGHDLRAKKEPSSVNRRELVAIGGVVVPHPGRLLAGWGAGE